MPENKLYADNSVLYIAGTTPTIDDVVTDLFIPIQQIKQTTRYQNAYDYIKKNEGTEHEIIEIVGHSLGAAVAEALSYDFPNKHFKMYGSPSIQGNPNAKKVHYYKHPYDPVAAFNIMENLTTAPLLTGFNPHSYEGYVAESPKSPQPTPRRRGRPRGNKDLNRMD